MFMIPRLAQGNGLLWDGSITKGSYFYGSEYAHGYSNAHASIGGSAFGSISGATALDGSGYVIQALFTYNPAGTDLTYLYIYMPTTGGSETKTSVFESLTINGVKKTSASATSFSHAGGDVYLWHWAADDVFNLEDVADSAALPFTAPAFVA